MCSPAKEMSMQETFDFAAYAHQVRKVAKTLMCSGGNAAEISGRMHLLTVAAERDLLRFGATGESSRVVCGPGCGSCCVLNVSVLFPEAVAITRYLQKRFAAEEVGELRGRLQQLTWRTRWLDDEERLFLRQPCAFLDSQGNCLIHRVRPLLCRSITSTDAQACREAVAMVALGGDARVEMDLFQKQLIDTVYCELGEALETLGLDSRPMRLSAAVLALLDEPDMVRAFIAGDRVSIH